MGSADLGEPREQSKAGILVVYHSAKAKMGKSLDLSLSISRHREFLDKEGTEQSTSFWGGFGLSASQSVRHLLILVGLTLLCLLPFSGKAFHIDDPLFLWSAQQITRHPLNPFGFQIVWDRTLTPMSEVTKNPPLACYYAAIIGSIGGWSERALHLGFLLPALALMWGTYRLAQRLSHSPLLAAMATLLTPGVMVSASSVMCDTLMLAFWIWAVTLWLEGLEFGKSGNLLASSFLIAASALTKYFGICLVPLLLTYSVMKQRRLGTWAWYFAIPLLALLAYQFWTQGIYGHGMLADAIEFAPHRVISPQLGPIFVLTTASFIGGCSLSAFTLAPILWSWRHILLGVATEGMLVAIGWAVFGQRLPALRMGAVLLHHWESAGLALAVCIGTGISVLALAGLDIWRKRNAESLLLALWVFGTFFFTSIVNWAINARSILPLIPAVGILIARRFDATGIPDVRRFREPAALALIASGFISFGIAQADANLANSAKKAAMLLHQRTRNESGAVWFQGHWGFQYYMEQLGFRPFDFQRCTLHPGDLLIIPDNAAETSPLPAQFSASSERLAIQLHQLAITHRWRMGAGYYGSYFGPLPFTFGAIAPEEYELERIGTEMLPEQWGLMPAHSDHSKGN
jgi:hypothetical protein